MNIRYLQNKNAEKISYPLILLTFILVWVSSARGIELSIPMLGARPGQQIEVPIQIDAVDNLAGVRIVMKYDAKMLKFKKAVRTDQTASLMHIVNDKKPGILIIVMAGPRGIKGKNLSILNLIFDVKQDLKGNHTTRFTITKSQLMSDQLKDINHTIKVNLLIISPK